MGTRKVALLVAAALMAGPIVANATSVTYDFTGTVYSATGIYSSISSGAAVTGTYIFNYGNANPTQSSGTIGSATSQSIQSAYGGEDYTVPLPSGYVFTSTANVGSISYSTNPLNSVLNASSDINTSSGFNFQADESSSLSLLVQTGSEFSNNGFSSAGLPVLYVGDNNAFFYTTNNGVTSEVQYDVTSLTPVSAVPLPAAAWLMLSGLGGFGVFARKKRAA